MSRRDQDADSSGTGAGLAWVLTRDAARDVDRLAVERYGIPSIVLMENAAIALRDASQAMMQGVANPTAVILCGPGNNGGDGYALARHLDNAGWKVRVLSSGDPAAARGDAGVNLGIIRAMGLPIHRLDRSEGAETLELAATEPVLLVDALLGTGVRDAAGGVIRDTILQVNRLRAPGIGVLAVDVPSGLDCDSGRPAGGGEAIEADATVTFVALKPGFLDLGAQRWTGELSVAGIGVPRELVRSLARTVRDTRLGSASSPGGGPGPDEPPTTHGRNTA